MTAQDPDTEVPQIRETRPEEAPALAALTAGALQWMLTAPTQDMRVLRLPPSSVMSLPDWSSPVQARTVCRSSPRLWLRLNGVDGA
ncbi:hypothetical protein V6L77_07485 [Pannonibacter sp. Pt2-lr]